LKYEPATRNCEKYFSKNDYKNKYNRTVDISCKKEWKKSKIFNFEEKFY